MDLAVLEIFRAVAEERSITKAAIRLQRVQSNVTTRIKQLEDELDVQLFIRDGKRMSLSERGEAFLEYVEKILAMAEEARQSMHPDRPSGKLRIGSMESTAATHLPGRLAKFHQECPEVMLELTTGPSRNLLDALQSRRLECILIACPQTYGDGHWHQEALPEGVESMAVFSEELLVVMPATHPPITSPADLQISKLAAFSQGCSYREIALSWIEGAGVEAQSRLEVQVVGSYHAILASISTGTCIGIVPRSLLATQSSKENFHTIPLLRVDTLLAWRKGYRTATLERFRSILQA